MGFSVDQWIALLSAAGAGGLVTKAAELLGKRAKDRQAEPAARVTAGAAFQSAVTAAAQELFAEYRAQLKFVRGRCDQLELKIDACEERHDQCEKNVAGLEARIVTLDRLMAGPVAEYRPRLPGDPES